MIESILNQIDLLKIAYDTTKGNHYTDDLYQELYLELLENSERTIDLNDRGELKPYVYRMAWTSYNAYEGKFYMKYRRMHNVIEDEVEGIKLSDVLDNADLTSIERQWIAVYLKHDCNKTWMESSTTICRKAIINNIKPIIDKCKRSL